MRHFREYSRSRSRGIPAAAFEYINKTLNEIKELESQLAKKETERNSFSFPLGYLSRQQRGPNVYIYQRWQEDNKKYSKYIGVEGTQQVISIRTAIDNRRLLDNEISNLKSKIQSLRKNLR